MTREQELLSALAKTAFRLNGQLLSVGERLVRPSGLTAASWQVLAAVLREPLPVADVAREIGVTRQSVQRIADLLVAQGHAEYRPNPAHRRAKLLAPSEAGRQAVRRIAPGHAAFAGQLAEVMGVRSMEQALSAIRRVSEALAELDQRRARRHRSPRLSR